MTSGTLIGRWSADTLYSPGAFSDEILNIRKDGTGRLDIWNLRLCEVIYFTWRSYKATLSVEGGIYVRLDEEGWPAEEHPWLSWHWTAVPYSVDVGTAALHPNGIEVLRIDHRTDFMHTRFGRLASEVPGDLEKYLRQD